MSPHTDDGDDPRAMASMTIDRRLSSTAGSGNSHVVQFRDGSAGHSLICFPGSGGNVQIFRALADALPEGHPVFGIDLGWLCDEKDDFTVEQLATLYQDVVKSLSREGTYHFCGYSFGGLLAYELAARLVGEGLDVRTVLLLDAPNPALLDNMSPGETAQYRKRYLLDRLKRYRDYLRSGDLRAFSERGLAFVVSRASKPFLPLIKFAARLSGTALPTIVRSNDPGFLKAWDAYKPPSYPKNVVCFRVDDRGAEHQDDPSMGWSDRALGGVEVHVVPGGHVGMMAMPSVGTIADVVATHLRGSDTERPGSSAASV